MDVYEIDVKVTMYPREDEEDGSVVILGNRSMRKWAEFNDIGAAMESVTGSINKLDAMGIHTRVESIEARHGDDVVVAWREPDGKLHWNYKCQETGIQTLKPSEERKA